MKVYTTFKTGYSKGIYGCSGEFFKTLIIESSVTNTLTGEISISIKAINHFGMYGSEERINRILEDAGYKFQYVDFSGYGQLKGRDDKAGYISGREAIEKINKLINPND